MANAMYAKGRQAFAAGDLDFDAHNFKIVGINTGVYTVDLANHDNLNDIAAGARTGTTANLASKTNVDGVLDAADTLIAAVTTNTQALALYRDTGTESTSTLVAYFDTGGGLPFTANGGQMNVIFSASGILKI